MSTPAAPALEEEVRLYTTNADREQYENLATLYGIIVTLDHLERSYVRDAIDAAQYAPQCTRLLSQYKTILKVLGDQVPSLDAFVSEYRVGYSHVAASLGFPGEHEARAHPLDPLRNAHSCLHQMDCTAAVQRLKIGVPATVEHSAQEGGGSETSKVIAETTQNFITLMDALKLKMRAKDQLHPILTELVAGYTKFPKSSEWQGRPKLLKWLISLNQMRASEEVPEDQAREMAFDVEQAYAEFFKTLR